MLNQLTAAKLVKVFIEGFKEDDFSGSLGTMELQVNPEKVSRTHQVKGGDSEKFPESKKYDGQAVATNRPPREYSGTELEGISFDFILDATGIIPGCVDVVEELTKFKDIAYRYYGEYGHEVPYVKLTWGKAFQGSGKEKVFTCRLSKLDVTYTLFKPSGTPLRAQIGVSFEDYVDPKKRAKLNGDKSPDMTHIRIVKPGDNLTLMCLEVYGSHGYYLDVARYNGLTSVFDVQPGQKIYFPPIMK